MKKLSILLVAAAIALATSAFKPGDASTEPASHKVLDELLKKYVNDKGNVNYKGLKTEKTKLENYLSYLSGNPPKDKWTSNQKKAYWINAYNAFCINLVLSKYPVKSIQDIGGAQKPWKVKLPYKIDNKELTLDYIEHEILRKQFQDARIHFGINCASFSCPKLNNKAYTGENIEAELTKMAKAFINDPTKNKLTSTSIEISEIFKWFKEDFSKSGSVINFINKYSNTPVQNTAKIKYMNYDWSLNE